MSCSYNSKQATGFVGLQNTLPKRGLYTPNSVVQMLFSIPAFRKVRRRDAGSGTRDVCVAAALTHTYFGLVTALAGGVRHTDHGGGQP